MKILSTNFCIKRFRMTRQKWRQHSTPSWLMSRMLQLSLTRRNFARSDLVMLPFRSEHRYQFCSIFLLINHFYFKLVFFFSCGFTLIQEHIMNDNRNIIMDKSQSLQWFQTVTVTCQLQTCSASRSTRYDLGSLFLHFHLWFWLI